MNLRRLTGIPAAGMALIGLTALIVGAGRGSSGHAGSGVNRPLHVPDLPSLASQVPHGLGAFSQEPDVPVEDRLFIVPVSSVDANAGAHLRQPTALPVSLELVGAVEDPERTPLVSLGHPAPVVGAAPTMAAIAPARERDDIGFHVLAVPAGDDLSTASMTDVLAQGGVDFYYTFSPETAPTAFTNKGVSAGSIAVVSVNGDTAWVQRINSSLSQLTMWVTDTHTGKRLLLTLHADKPPDALVQLARQAA